MADPTWTDEDWIKRRATMADQMWKAPISGSRFSWAEGLLGGLGSGLGNLDVQNSIDTNKRMTTEALKGAASQPNSRALSRYLIGSGVPPLGTQGLGLLAGTMEKEADRASAFEQQKQLFRFQKQEALDADMRKRKQDMDLLRSLGALPPEGGTAVAPTTPTTPAGPVNSNSAFIDDLLTEGAHKSPSPAQKAGIALVLGEKGKAADALMEKGGKLTEGQTKDAGFAERMLRAEAGMREVVPIDKSGTFLKYDPTSNINRFLPDWNLTNSAEWQTYQRNAREGVAAILRKDTGAAVSDTEWNWYFPMYYPQPGDSAQVVADKQRARIAVARGLRAASGPAFDQMFPRFNEQLRARLEAAGADLTPKPAGGSAAGGASASGAYTQIKKNPKTGAMVGFNAQTGQWEPIAPAAAEPAPALGEMAAP